MSVDTVLMVGEEREAFPCVLEHCCYLVDSYRLATLGSLLSLSDFYFAVRYFVMTVIVSGQHRTAWFGLGFIFFVIWSLYTLNISSVSSVGVSQMLPQMQYKADFDKSTIYDDFIETQEQTVDAAASIAFGTEDSTTSLVTASTLTLTGQTPSNLADESSDTALLLSEIPLILFAYSESETARVNIEFFIRHGLHAAADFIFILNGATDIASIIPKEFNIRVVQRENDCYDIGAYAEVLTKDDLYKGYKRFIMLNASLRGPFIPYWAKGCWSDMYLGRITDEVKVRPIPHTTRT